MMTRCSRWVASSWVLLLSFVATPAGAQLEPVNWEIRGTITSTDAFEFSTEAVVADAAPFTITRQIMMMPGTPSGVKAVAVEVDPESVHTAVLTDISLPNNSNFGISHYNWHNPTPDDYLASVVNSLQLRRLYSTDGVNYSSSLISTTTGYASSEAGRSADTDYVAGYHQPSTDYHVYTATSSSSSFTLAEVISGTVVETIFGWPRTGFAVDAANTYCVAFWVAQSATHADGFYKCTPGGSPQQFHDDLPVISGAFPEAISRWVTDGGGDQVFVYSYICGTNVCAMWTDGSSTFQRSVLGPGPVLDATNRFYSIGLTQILTRTDRVEVAWPDEAVELDMSTGFTDTLGAYPFTQSGPNGLFSYDRFGQPTLAALGNGSVLLATLTGSAGVGAPTMSWWALIATALVLVVVGNVLLTRQRQPI